MKQFLVEWEWEDGAVYHEKTMKSVMKTVETKRMFDNPFIVEVTFNHPIEDTDEIVALEPNECVCVEVECPECNAGKSKSVIEFRDLKS